VPFRSGAVYRSYKDFDCFECFGAVEEGEEYGYVDGEKVCEDCWDVAGEGMGFDAW